MRAAGFSFEVTENPWKLYVGDRQYGALGYSGFHAWEVLQDRYLLCSIMEYAATLGLIDIAYQVPDRARNVENWGMDADQRLSRYDGLSAFRVNHLGAYCLGGDEKPYKPSRPVSTIRLSVLADGTIHVVAGLLAHAERARIESWAVPLDDHTFRIDDARALDAVENGLEPDAFAEFLREHGDQPLPKAMESFIQRARDNGGAIRQSGTAIPFECRDARLAALLSTSKELKKICLRAGDTTLAVREDAVPAFRKCARAMGFGVR